MINKISALPEKGERDLFVSTEPQAPTPAEWRRLYEVAARIKDLAPWEWMVETDVFGVQDPETDQFGFVSVMGTLGEHYAIAVYLGPAGLYGFWQMQELGSEMDADSFFEIPQLQLSFEDRNDLRAKDREIIKQLELKFRGRQAWPQFSSFRPGYAPWLLEAAEARFLTHVLEQTLDVATRFRDTPELLNPPGDWSYLVRRPRQVDQQLTWEDSVESVPPPEPSSISLTMDVPVLEKLKRLPQSKVALEIDFFMLPAQIQEKGARPYFPYTLMIVDASNGMILGHDMLQPQPSLEKMWGLIPMHVVYQLARSNIRPKEIKVRSQLLYQLLQALVDELHFKLKSSHRLPMLDEAKGFLFDRFLG
jgi:hypothetical protein